MAALAGYKGYDLEIAKTSCGDWTYTVYAKSGMALAYGRAGGFDTKAKALAAAKDEVNNRAVAA